MRNPLRKEPEAAPVPIPQAPALPEPTVQIVEREITLSVVNEKLNYAIGILHKIAEAAELDIK